MAKNRSAEKEEFWRLVLQEQRESGMTIKAFCDQQGVSPPSFYAWKRKFKLPDAQTSQDAAAQENRMIPVQVVGGKTSRSERSSGPSDNDSNDAIEIASPSGFVFRFGAGVSLSRLNDVVATVDPRGRQVC